MLPLYGYNAEHKKRRNLMRIIFATLLALSPLFAIGEKTETMSAQFIQTITDDKSSTITYEGTMSAKRPNMALWHYTKPVDKTIYISAENVTIVEPELEQAIVKRLGNTIDILAILASAQREGKESYVASYNDKEYHIALQNNKIKSISYNDAFDNSVKIIFSEQKINQTIENSHFKAQIPADFDIIKD